MSPTEVNSKKKVWRLSQAARKLNVGTHSIVSFLGSQGHDISDDPNGKINADQFLALQREFATSVLDKEEASLLEIGQAAGENVVLSTHKDTRTGWKAEEKIQIKNLSSATEVVHAEKAIEVPKEAPKKPVVVGKISLDKRPEKAVVEKKKEETTPKKVVEAPPKAPVAPKKEEKPAAKEEVLRSNRTVLQGTKVLDKITLQEPIVPTRSSEEKKKRPRKRIADSSLGQKDEGRRKERLPSKEAPSHKEVSENIKATLAKLSRSSGAVSLARGRLRKERRIARIKQHQEETSSVEQESKKLQITEFASVSDLASLMGQNVNDVIASCMQLGMFVSINQRLDSEEISIIADEFGYEEVSFNTLETGEEAIEDESEALPNDTKRAPVVTVMGHVDHGKTSLLDIIRKTRVATAEAGGITQHIGAYEVLREDHKVVFLDTPGHAAFTAMRARGTRLTDLAIIVVAADDKVMPQTEEAINHVKVAGVPFIVAINKIDKEGASAERIREQLSKKGVLVEEWGGKVQSQEISAKTGKGVDDLLEKVLLESDLMELKANEKRRATGSVIEASLDKGRGYVANLLVQNGSIRVGDVLLAGMHTGRVKALFDQMGKRIRYAGPATPTQMLGLDGPTQAGDKFVVMPDEREAREIATRRQQISRQQSMRTKRHLTLDDISKRLAVGAFKELNLLIKGDVDGSVEALCDSLLKLSTEEVQVNIIHRGIGQISESDVMLASASEALVIGFQVRPSESAKAAAQKERIEIRLYSIIFEAINELQDAVKGMHEPKIEEVVTATLEVKQVFRIAKVGVVAGCKVQTGKIGKEHRVRVIRDGIVIHEGEVSQLKHFSQDVNEVKQGSECGIAIKAYQDTKVGDSLESYTRQTLVEA